MVNRGYFCIAQNSPTNDYVKLAYALALSLKITQPTVNKLSIGVTPGTEVSNKYKQIFDEIIDIPGNDEAAEFSWKLQNIWKVREMTPYDETIQLDSDMLFPFNIEPWWEILTKTDFWACTTVRTYRGNIATCDFYRKCFTLNKLPNVYNAFMYFKKDSNVTKRVYDTTQLIFQNWEEISEQFLEPTTRPKKADSDVAFALAIKMLGLDEQTTNTNFEIPTFLHMKTQMQGWKDIKTEDWLEHVQMYVIPRKGEIDIRIGEYRQLYPVHYYLKYALTDDIIKRLEKKVGI